MSKSSFHSEYFISPAYLLLPSCFLRKKLRPSGRALTYYLNSSFPPLMASEIKSSPDPEYIIRPAAASGRIWKLAANSSSLKTSG